MLYLWLILTVPQDRLICELWTRDIPTQSAIVQACGTDVLEKYTLFVTQNGVSVCEIPAVALSTVNTDCSLVERLDAYKLRIVEKDFQTAICTVRTMTESPPIWGTVRTQCPNAEKYGAHGIQIKFWTTRQPEPEPVSVCMPPPTKQPSNIATHENYHLLAGKLIWFGIAKSNCPGGYSGVDAKTFAATPCGLDGARPQMIAWQNGLDDAILQAATQWHVPADLLKRIIAAESQFWTWTGTDGEHGLIQITDAGADVVMHFYQDGYYHMTNAERQSVRSAWLRKLDCLYCTPIEAYEHAKQVMSYYAQALAAYYCMYGSWDSAVRAWNIKHINHD